MIKSLMVRVNNCCTINVPLNSSVVSIHVFVSEAVPSIYLHCRLFAIAFKNFNFTLKLKQLILEFIVRPVMQ